MRWDETAALTPFSFNLKGGCCEEREGEGVIATRLYFMPGVDVACAICKWCALRRRDSGIRPPRDDAGHTVIVIERHGGEARRDRRPRKSRRPVYAPTPAISSSRSWKLLLHPRLPPPLVARRRGRALLPVQIKSDGRHHLRSHGTNVQDRESRRGRLQPNQLECVA